MFRTFIHYYKYFWNVKDWIYFETNIHETWKFIDNCFRAQRPGAERLIVSASVKLNEALTSWLESNLQNLIDRAVGRTLDGVVDLWQTFTFREQSYLVILSRFIYIWR